MVNGAGTINGLMYLLSLYFQDPKFAFHLVQLITRRLVENCARIEALPGRWPEAGGLRAKAAA